MKTRTSLLIAFMLISQIGFTQTDISSTSSGSNDAPLISGIHTLSIHVRDTLTQDSVTRFLRNILALPVYYTPVKLGIRRYSGLYAGNMVLEPCGPYPNISYGSDEFRAIFFGLNFEVHESLESGEGALKNLGIKHQVNNGSIYIKDSLLCSENVFTALYKVSDEEKRDSLKQALWSLKRKHPGIEYIKDIAIGYKKEIHFAKWKEFLHPLEVDDCGYCPLNDSVRLQFVRANAVSQNG